MIRKFKANTCILAVYSDKDSKMRYVNQINKKGIVKINMYKVGKTGV
jgi:hypothetical protein